MIGIRASLAACLYIIFECLCCTVCVLRQINTVSQPPRTCPNNFQEKSSGVCRMQENSGRGPSKEANSVPQTLYLMGRGWLPPLSVLGDSPLTRNRRLGPCQHDGRDPPVNNKCAFCRHSQQSPRHTGNPTRHLPRRTALSV